MVKQIVIVVAAVALWAPGASAQDWPARGACA